MARLAQRIALDPSRDYFTREFDPSILPSIRPAIGRVLIDDESRVWVERDSMDLQSIAVYNIVRP